MELLSIILESAASVFLLWIIYLLGSNIFKKHSNKNYSINKTNDSNNKDNSSNE